MRRGFTLIELMIALAMMCILMVGVNYIFSSVGSAVGTTQTMSKVMRDGQAAHSVIQHDLNGIALDGPCILLGCSAQPAFRNHMDELGAVDPTNPLMDRDSSGAPFTHGAAIYDDRVHRQDILSFFSRGSFPRQTGNDGIYMANQSASEAWIWFGHLLLADNGTAYKRPGEGDQSINPNNYYASQWVLGREAMLLVEPDSSGQIFDTNGVPQHFIKRATSAASTSLAPLSVSSNSDDSVPSTRIESSRYDVAGASITGFKSILSTVIATNIVGNPGYDWWGRLFLDDTVVSPIPPRRFRGSAYPGKPMTSSGAARVGPLFVHGCSQFMVEYAGDFIKQDQDPASPTYGDATDAYFDPVTGLGKAGGTDGEIDFVVNPADKMKRVRWYGMPRDTDGNRRIPGQNGSRKNNEMPDVIPLRDVLKSILPYAAVTGAPFERFTAPPPLASYPDYTAMGFEHYICAWGPTDRKPSMLRIILSMDDPNGRISPQTFEYVFRMQ